MTDDHRQDHYGPEEIGERVVQAVQEEKQGLGVIEAGAIAGDIDLPGDNAHSRIPSQDLYRAMDCGQDGDAGLFAELNRDRFCYDHAAGSWFKWNAHYWVEDKVDEILTGLNDVVAEYETEIERLTRSRMIAANEGNKDEDRRLASQIQQYKRKLRLLHTIHWKKSVLKLAAAGNRSLGIIGDEWDTDPWLLGCKNGVIDLRTGELRPGKQADYIKTLCPTEWKGLDEPAPTWEKFLGDTFNKDPEVISFLQRLLGYAITGLTTEHIFPILWGQGRNGKGTLLETLFNILGPIAGPVQAEMLLQQQHSASSSSPRSDIIALRGRRLAWASETNEGRKLNIGRVKWLSGGDTLTGRAPYGKREVSFTATHTLFLLTNHKPQVDANDFAMWQRLFLIPFALSFVDNPKRDNERERDPHLPQRLKAEAPGILAWLVRGCLAWQSDGLNPPQVVMAATDEYRNGEDLMGHFVQACCHSNPNYQVKAGALYAQYQKWCEENGYSAVSNRKFGECMKKRFDHVKRDCIYYLGLALGTDR